MALGSKSHRTVSRSRIYCGDRTMDGSGGNEELRLFSGAKCGVLQFRDVFRSERTSRERGLRTHRRVPPKEASTSLSLIVRSVMLITSISKKTAAGTIY